MHAFLRFCCAVLIAPLAWPANLAVSTYFKDGFTPSAVAADAQGNILVAGNAIIDPKAQIASAAVAKFDSKASQFLYLTYLDSAANDVILGMTVDSAGNAYVTGLTQNPDFPATGGSLGTAPTSTTDRRSFVAKINPQGVLVFAVLLGGSVPSTAHGIAVTPQGQILVSGTVQDSGFPVTQGAYSIGDSRNHWFLMELDPTATKMIFSAVGIGGSALALDSSGNIYMSGSSVGIDYPTTGGAYQTTFVQGYTCSFLCQIAFPGGLQHVTKVDPTGAMLIYSTGLNDIQGGAGSTINTGLAVDADGNAYVTGTLYEANYPFPAAPTGPVSGFLSKLDSTGSNLLFSIPFGGAGVQLDGAGAVYAGGTILGQPQDSVPVPVFTPQMPSVFSWIPSACLVNSASTTSGAYELKVDAVSGALLDGQWIDGSSPVAVAGVFSGGKFWLAGTAMAPDVPATPGAITPFAPLALRPGFLQGAWLSGVDFSGAASSGPRIACVLDSGNFAHVGGVTGFQLISIFGANLGPAQGMAAPDGMDPLVGGDSATFDGNNTAQLLYVSDTQVNLAVPLPLPSQQSVAWNTQTTMALTAGGDTVVRQFPYLLNNLSLFTNMSTACVPTNPNESQTLTLNADGSLNSCTNPAAAGSTVSFFMQGIGAEQLGFPPVGQISDLTATIGGCAVQISSAALTANYVYRVDVTMPPKLSDCPDFTSLNNLTGIYEMLAVFDYKGVPVGPFTIPTVGSFAPWFDPGQPKQAALFAK